MKKILHINDTAGVASLISKELNRLNHKSKVIARLKSTQKLNITSNYNTKIISGSYKKFLLFIIKELILFRPNIVHIHYWFDGINIVHLISKLLFFNPKLIYHAHGDDIRGLLKNKSWNASKLKSDINIVATKDILFPNAIHLPNPIDTNMFYKHDNKQRVNNDALYIRTRFDRKDYAIDYSKKHNLKLTIIDRIDGNGVPYRELPNIFQKYEYYLDFKGLTNKEVISKTAMEALASGVKVVTDDGFIIEPDDADFSKRLNSFVKLYENL